MAVTVFTRRRTESTRSTGSITPADELASWLGDDVCTNCGNPVHAGNLYCSQQCREDDAKAIDKDAVSSAPKVAASANEQSVSFPQTTDFRFRYAPPTSPHLSARYNAALTSPALAAHDRTANSQDKDWSLSSEYTRNRNNVYSANRRSLSQSTYSSASDAPSTDPSTPSPHISKNDVFDEEFEPTVLDLPPSITPAASVLLNYSARDRDHQSGKRSPTQKMSALPSFKRETPQTTMSFARRPSRTNVPAPVLFTSPVLSTTVMKAQQATPRRLSNDNDASKAKSTIRKAAAVPLKRQSKQSGNTSPTLSPQVNSASSSAGKTLRALSPVNSFGNTQSNGSVCGRFGCYGLSSSTESEGPLLQHSSSDQRLAQRARPSMLFKHKHTHSAAADLDKFLEPSVRRPLESSAMNGVQDKSSAPEDVSSVPAPRGRSKARGRSSTSRRSPSPPRGAARRGRSEDFKAVASGAVAPLSSTRSSPRAIRTSSPSHERDIRDSDVENEAENRRGRSPTERGRINPSKPSTKQRSPIAAMQLQDSKTLKPSKTNVEDKTRLGALEHRSASDSSGYDDVDLDEL